MASVNKKKSNEMEKWFPIHDGARLTQKNEAALEHTKMMLQKSVGSGIQFKSEITVHCR